MTLKTELGNTSDFYLMPSMAAFAIMFAFTILSGSASVGIVWSGVISLLFTVLVLAINSNRAYPPLSILGYVFVAAMVLISGLLGTFAADVSGLDLSRAEPSILAPETGGMTCAPINTEGVVEGTIICHPTP